MSEQQPEDAWSDVESAPEPVADVEPTSVEEEPRTDADSATTVENTTAEPKEPEPVQGFQLSTADVVALVNDRTAEKMSVSTFRTLVAHGEGPDPISWGRTPLWSFAVVEDWISDMFASGAFTAPVIVLEMPEPEQEEQPEPELVFGSTAQWVENFLLPMYRRNMAPNGAGSLNWCPQWWQHAEAIIRLEALWRAWEHLRLDGKTGMSVFMKDHLDHHMPVLMDGSGPFDGCSQERGHLGPPDGLKPFPVTPAPLELFPDVRKPVTETKES